ncbi:unnamed protein product [Strongylus vulgaris]|uniref:Uncharacterized protein n=1 Tax=Strongylus vulgaris TaxID=40348 RepID=A0A3P7KHU5_STRVU|nr:unnamed protein product [Strongylus vulgaris]
MNLNVLSIHAAYLLLDGDAVGETNDRFNRSGGYPDKSHDGSRDYRGRSGRGGFRGRGDRGGFGRGRGRGRGRGGGRHDGDF